MTRLTLLTVGSRGDVQPYIALGIGLQQAGYDVTLASNENFADFVTSYGLKFFPLTGNSEEVVRGQFGRTAIDSGRNPIQLVRAFRDTLNSVIEPFLADVWEVCHDADAIVHGLLGFFGETVAEKQGIPSVGAFLQATNRTRQHPSLAAPNLRLGGAVNMLTHKATEQLFWQAFRPIINRWRTETLDLPALPLSGPFPRFEKYGYPVVYGYSNHIFPRPLDWGQHLQVSGYWFLGGSADWQPPVDLVDFIADGPPPVYVGFGSMSSRDPEKTASIVVDALKRGNRRAVLNMGWGGMTQSDLPDSIFAASGVPHEWLFPQMAAVVHHGGMGTTSAGYRAGVPQVIVPFFGDQFLSAKTVYDLGVGPKHTAHSKLTPERLEFNIRFATSNPAIVQRSAELGAKIRAEDGVTNAVNILKQYLPQPKRAVYHQI